MERATAIKKLTKLLGGSLGYRVNDNAPTAEVRTAAYAEFPIAKQERENLQARLTARRDALLDADPEYQTLLMQHADARKRVERLSGLMHRYRFTAGISRNVAGLGMFEVKAEGDTWEEVIVKIELQAKAKAIAK